MTTSAYHGPNVPETPHQQVLIATHQRVAEAQQFITTIWLAHPLLRTLDPAIGAIVRHHLTHCCARANAYEIGAISAAELDSTLDILIQLLDQMQQTVDDVLRIRVDYADALTETLAQTKPDFAALMAQRVAQTWDAMTTPEPTMSRLHEGFTRMEQLVAIAEFVIVQEEHHG